MAAHLPTFQGPVIFAERARFDPRAVARRVLLAALAVMAVGAVIVLRVVAWWPSA